jgi:hypothetical protein
MGELVGIDELLIGRPLPLELLERGRVDHRAPRLKLMDMFILPPYDPPMRRIDRQETP